MNKRSTQKTREFSVVPTNLRRVKRKKLKRVEFVYTSTSREVLFSEHFLRFSNNIEVSGNL